MTMRLNDIINTIDASALLAVFLEDDPETSNLTDALYFGKCCGIYDFEYFNMLQYITVETIIPRSYEYAEDTAVISIGLVC